MAEMHQNNLANENETLSAEICPADSKNKKEKPRGSVTFPLAESKGFEPLVWDEPDN